ncbi:MAG: hypothetical protein WC832_01370 [Anaerolineales bacterium]
MHDTVFFGVVDGDEFVVNLQVRVGQGQRPSDGLSGSFQAPFQFG